MNHQQIYNRVLKHMRKQRKVSYDRRDGRCAYRARDVKGNVLMCAVGCLIPDEAYNPNMEGAIVAQFVDLPLRSVADILERDKRALALARALDTAKIGCDADTLKLLSQLQDTHDGLKIERGKAVMRQFELNMQSIAKRFKLTYTPPRSTRRV